MKALHWGLLAAAVGGLSLAARNLFKDEESQTDMGKEIRGTEKNAK